MNDNNEIIDQNENKENDYLETDHNLISKHETNINRK